MSVLAAVAAAVCAAAAIVELAAAARAGVGPAGRGGRDAGGGGAGRTSGRGAGRRSRRGGRALRALGQIGRRIGSPAAPGDLQARLAAAGVSPVVGAGEVMAVKAGTTALALLAVLPLLPALPTRLTLAVAVGAPCAGFLAPDFWLRRRAAARASVVSRELPDVLDLLRVAVEAGLPAIRAISEVGRRRRGLLAAEMRAVATRIELGVAQADALAGLVARCPHDGVVAMASALARADRHGAPPGPALAALAARSRADRARGLRENAARAAPKMQLVVALLLVPAAMLLVAAATVASLAD